MSSYVSVEITCPHCDKTHRFTMVPEGATGKKTGVDHSHQTRTSEELAEKLRELKGKPDERTAGIRKQIADLKGKDEKGRTPKLSKKSRSRLLSKHLKGRPESSRKPNTSALLDNKLSQMSHIHDIAAMLADKGVPKTL